MEKLEAIKFLGISWKDHIKYIENKVAKNIGLLYRAKQFLDKNSLFIILFVYSHLFQLCKFILGQWKQSKSKKATQSLCIPFVIMYLGESNTYLN